MNRRDLGRIAARVVIDALIILAIVLGAVFILLQPDAAGAAREPLGASRMHATGTVTHMGYTAGLPGGVHYAATHHGDHQATFVRGVTLRLEHHRHHLIVRIVDVCAGSACRMLDLSSAGFRRLFGSTAQGVGRVTAYCGRAGKKPMRKCLAGEDQ